MKLHSTRKNFKLRPHSILLNGTKYWVYDRYGTGRYVLSDYTFMTIKILKNAGWKGEIPMTKKWQYSQNQLPEMEIDKALCYMTLPENHRLLHLIN